MKRILSFSKWYLAYADALWAPRYIENGWAAFDVSWIQDIDVLRTAPAEEAPEFPIPLQCIRDSTTFPARHMAEWPGTESKHDPDEAPLVRRHLEAQMFAVHIALLPLVNRITGVECIPTVSYGPRIYQRGNILIGHLDAYPEHTFTVSIPLSDGEWDLDMRDLSIEGTKESQWSVPTKAGTGIIYEGGRVMHARMTPCPYDRYEAAFYHYRPREFTSGHGEMSLSPDHVQYGVEEQT